jgi:hypothetical protein
MFFRLSSSPIFLGGLAHGGMTHMTGCLADRERAFAQRVEHGELLRQGAVGEFAAQRFFTFKHSFQIKGHFALD